MAEGESMSTSLRAPAGGPKNPLQEALLIKAQTRILQLESEVCRLRDEAMAENLKRDFNSAHTFTDLERQNQVW